MLWTLYELARHPNLQEELRAEVATARAESQGDMLEMLKRIPLVKGALKETLRLHPVAVSLQRYIAEDIIIQNYHIPAGVSSKSLFVSVSASCWATSHLLSIFLCSDSGPVRSVCNGQGPQSVFPPRAVSALPLAEDRDAVLQESELWLRPPSVFGTENS